MSPYHGSLGMNVLLGEQPSDWRILAFRSLWWYHSLTFYTLLKSPVSELLIPFQRACWLAGKGGAAKRRA